MSIANDNGKLEFFEFCEIIAKNRKSLEQEEEELRTAFLQLDKNGDGTCDREELKKVRLAPIGYLISRLLSLTRLNTRYIIVRRRTFHDVRAYQLTKADYY